MASAFGKILLITGNAEFLADRTRAKAEQAIGVEDPDCEIAHATCSGLAPGEIATLTSPSLFSSSSALVLTELQDLADVAQQELLAYVAAPSPDIAVILVHSGGGKGRGLLDKLRAQSAVHEVKLESPKYERDYARWVTTEMRDLGATLDEQAAALLVTAVGQDLRALAGAADQLANSIEPGSGVTVEVVRQYFGGRADVRGYEIADAAIDGRLSVALEHVRWADGAKVPAVVIIASFANGLRSLARVAGAAPGLKDADVARAAGVPPFKVRVLRQQLRGWSSSGLRQAMAAVAQADREVKNGDADASFAVERMVLKVAASRNR